MSSETWFAGDSPEGDDGSLFLVRVRELAPAALTDRVDPSETAIHPYGCLIGIQVPGVPASEWPVYRHHLQVLFEPGLLGGYWGCSHLWDDFDPADPEALNITAALGPDEAADLAVAWLRQQLHRPLVVQEWDQRLYGTTLRRWVLADTGRVLAGKARPPRRRPSPDRVVQLWPPAA